MKTELKDYIMCGFLLMAITCASLLSTFLVTRLLFSWIPFGAYAGIFGVLFFLLSYGLISGFVVRLFFKFRPLQEGYFAMDSATFRDWKLLIIVSDFGNMALSPFNFVFLKPFYATLYGAKIGKDVALAEGIQDAFMVEIGHNTIVGAGTWICGNYLEKERIFIAPVTIGNNVTIGMNSVILPNTTIKDGATLSIGSVVMPGTVIPAGETWKGNPARKWQ